MSRNNSLLFLLMFGTLLLHGCSALLPSSREVVQLRWKTFEEIKTAYDQVIAEKTDVPHLRKLGFDIYSSPNVKFINYLDIATVTQNIKDEDLGAGLSRCIKARDACRGYQFEPRIMKSQRVGNFWLDIFNFRRKTKGTGWHFRAVFLVIDDMVSEKFWSGDPLILEEKEMKNPLGPFQDAGGILQRF